jgi:REP element-mobilizing transposase RayT
MPDHVHLVARFRADVAVADLLRVIKANSSKWANERPDRAAVFAWQAGYGAFTVSESQLEVVRRYVQRQEEHHRELTFQEEFVALLKKHSIEYDERYLWD